jgi:uncharacterized protein YxjI
MGDTPSKYDEPLQPQQRQICPVDSRFCIPQEITLHLREKIFSFSGDDFKIKDPNTGQVWFQIQGKAFSLREKKTMLDAYGTPVLNIKETFAFMESNYKVYLGDNSEHELFKVIAHITFSKAKAHTTIVNRTDNQQLIVTLKGDIFSKAACIYLGEAKQGGIPIAKIYRPFTGRGHFFDAQDYYLTVAPNVDISFAVALCICLDEMKKDN